MCGDEVAGAAEDGVRSSVQRPISFQMRAEITWLLCLVSVGALTGLSSALLILALRAVTDAREQHGWLLFGLPVMGICLGTVYQKIDALGKIGTARVLRAMRAPQPTLSFALAPLVFLGTALTHLFGGSAGREGTAVQMAAGVAAGASRLVGATPQLSRDLLYASAAAAFGATFNTPIAGVFFSLALLPGKQIKKRRFVGNAVATGAALLMVKLCGIRHEPYPKVPSVRMTPLLLGKWCVFAVVIAAAAWSFLWGMQEAKRVFARLAPHPGVRMGVGGCLLIAMTYFVQDNQYLGLGDTMIRKAFVSPEISRMTPCLKMVFTVVTLGSGFLGGEVTPLFFTGASLGNLLALVLNIPLPLGAAVGLATLFGATAKMPFAFCLAAIELFGFGVTPHVVWVAFIASPLSGQRALYEVPSG